MTEEERRNRNPKPEVRTVRLADHPEVRSPAELERSHVYIVDGLVAATVNYVGTLNGMDPATLDAMVCYHFHGPRVGLDIYLRWRNGSFEDDRSKVIVRKYLDPDA